MKQETYYPIAIDRKRDCLIFSSKNKQIVFGEMLRQVLGVGIKGRLGHWCSPGSVSKNTEIPYSTIRGYFREFEERHIITYVSKYREEFDNSYGWIEVNPNTEEWVE